MKPILLPLCLILFLYGCNIGSTDTVLSEVEEQSCNVEFVILGIGQDAGAPQIGNDDDPAWADSKQKLWAASGALIDHRNNQSYLFEATPDIREQMHYLDNFGAEGTGPLGLSGVFLTHAHIGHYAGLMFAGHESAGTDMLNVYAMPGMKNYLENNGPWDQLVRFDNIEIQPLQENEPTDLAQDISVEAHLVPHRDEYSETVGFIVSGPSKKLLFLPDIDDWDQWESQYEQRIEDMIAKVDIALLDATFFDDFELPGRDMSKIPHPRVADSMERFSKLPKSESEKLRFFHINHTNAIRDPKSEKSKLVEQKGFKVARRGDHYCMD